MIDLTGIPFKHGSDDCYGLLRRYYAQEHGLTLTDYARPDDWWDQGLDLYNENYWNEGFRPFDGHPREWVKSDLILMAVRSNVANHAGIYLGDGKILHHFYGRFSCIEPYVGLWRKATTAVLRHKDIVIVKEPTRAFDLAQELPAYFRRSP